MIDYQFNRRSQRYYDKTNGRFVSRNAVREAVNLDLKEKANQAEMIMDSYLAGEINKQELEKLTAKLIKITHIQHYKIGKPELEETDYNLIREKIASEYIYLRRFTNDLDNLSENQAKARARMYFSNTSSFDEGARQSYKQNGWLWERRRLRVAEHCPECVSYNRLGWQLIGTLPAIAARSSCLANCKCYFEFSKSITRPRS